ncbi:hypothetical protein P9J64_16830 [Deltaproteobacteria bacterium IMCC39524]|nr:hypothetical protein [Deltaproteobacteria bacterium IMCC39524]
MKGSVLMSGASTAIAISEMYRFAREAALRVRAQLFRLHCSRVIFVEQEKTWLKLTYGDQCYVTAPLVLLAKLRKIQEVKQADDLWELITQEPAKKHESTVSMVFVVIFFLIFILIAILTIYVV